MKYFLMFLYILIMDLTHLWDIMRMLQGLHSLMYVYTKDFLVTSITYNNKIKNMWLKHHISVR